MADLVSVVIPIFNTNDRFKTCFESVLNQKYKDIEVILVDDGSSDASAEICDMIAQSTSEFPAFVIHKPNGGVSRARNLGIDFAGVFAAEYFKPCRSEQRTSDKKRNFSR